MTAARTPRRYAHDLTAAHYVADRIVVMQAGQIVESGPAEQVVTAPTHDYTRLLLAAAGGVASTTWHARS